MLLTLLRRSGAPVGPVGPVLAISEGFSGAVVGLHGSSPDTLGSPATWQVNDTAGTVTDGIRRDGSGRAALTSASQNAEAIINHGADVVEMTMKANLGDGASGSNIRQSGLIFGADPSRSTNAHTARGCYIVDIVWASSFKGVRLFYSPTLSTAASVVASYSFTTAANTDYALRVTVQGGEIKVFVDGVERISYTATPTNRAYSGIMMGLSLSSSLSPFADDYKGYV